VVELLLSEHNGECQTCDRNEDCELQSLAAELGIRELSIPAKNRNASTPRPGPGATAASSAAATGARVGHRTSAVSQNRGFDTVMVRRSP
jgi:hypothetical protein